MAALRKLFGKKDDEDSEEEEGPGLDEVIKPEGSDSSEDQGGIGQGIGISPESNEGKIGADTEMKEKINRNEERLNEVQTTTEQLDKDVSNMDARLEGLEDDISRLLDVYEMVTAQINPFLDNKPPEKSADQQEGLQGVLKEEGLESQKIDQQQQYEPSEETTRRRELDETESSTPSQQPMREEGEPTLKTSERIPKDVKTKDEGSDIESLRSPEEIYEEIEPGQIYLLKTESPVLGFEVLKEAKDKDEKALCITRKHPDQIKDGFGLEGSDFVWLSSSTESYSIRPNQLDALGLKIERFISEDGDVILLDGLAYLFSNNPDSTLLHFIQSIQDQITVSETALILPVDINSIEEDHIKLIKNELNLKEISLQKEKSEEKMEGEKMEQEESGELVDDMEDMVDYLVEEEKELEKKVEEQAKDSSVTKKEEGEEGQKDELIIEAIDELKEEIKDLRHEIKEKKEEEIEDEEAEKKEGSAVEEEAKEEEIKRTSEPSKRPEETVEEDIKEEVEEVEEEVEEEIEELRDEEPERTIAEKEIEDMIEQEFEEVGLPQDEPTRQFVKDIVKAFQKKRQIEEGMKPTGAPGAKGARRLSGDVKADISSKEKIIITQGASIEGDLKSEDSIVLEDNVEIKGDITSYGNITLGQGCSIEGDLISKKGTVEIGEGSKVKGRVDGNVIILSSDVDIGEISAVEKVVLGEDSVIEKVSSKGSVEIKSGVKVEGSIEYRRGLSLDGSDIVIYSGVHPLEKSKKSGSDREERNQDKEEEVVSERWASQ